MRIAPFACAAILCPQAGTYSMIRKNLLSGSDRMGGKPFFRRDHDPDDPERDSVSTMTPQKRRW
jgi:hypothetical protein